MAAACTETRQYRLVFRPDGDLLTETRRCEAEVFQETYGNTPADFIDEYGAYEDASYFIALADDADNVVGACRLIAPSSAGLKTINDVSRAPWRIDGARAARAVGADLSSAWDVATLAVRPGQGVSPLAAAALYHGLVMVTRANAIDWIVMMLDERARRLLAMAGFVARPIPGTSPAPYLGSSASTPLIGNVAGMIADQRRENPEAYRLMTMGQGLIDVSVPPLEYWRVGNWSSVTRHDAGRALARTA